MSLYVFNKLFGGDSPDGVQSEVFRQNKHKLLKERTVYGTKINSSLLEFIPPPFCEAKPKQRGLPAHPTRGMSRY